MFSFTKLCKITLSSSKDRFMKSELKFGFSCKREPHFDWTLVGWTITFKRFLLNYTLTYIVVDKRVKYDYFANKFHNNLYIGGNCVLLLIKAISE